MWRSPRPHYACWMKSCSCCPRHSLIRQYDGASLAQRVQLLESGTDRFAQIFIGTLRGWTLRGNRRRVSRGVRRRYAAEFLVRRDAAERVAGWDYGGPAAFPEMLRQFDLIVAARCGEYFPPESLAGSFTRLELNGAFDHVSASEVRDRIARGEPWEHLVPPAVRGLVGEIYTPGKK